MIFVTGGTGLVGAHMLLTLIQAGEEVNASFRSDKSREYTRNLFSFYGKEELFSAINWVQLDLENSYDVSEAMKGVKHVYHCAAMVDLQNSSAMRLIEANVTLTANLVNAALLSEVEAFCHVSSVATLANTAPGIPADEEAIWTTGEKKSAYAISKFYSEMEVWRGNSEGLNVVVVNPSVIIGPAKSDAGSGLLFRQVWKGMPFYTSGGTGVVAATDVTKAMYTLMKEHAYGKRYVLNGENISYKTMFSLIAEALGKKAPSRLLPQQVVKVASHLTRVLHPVIPAIPVVSKTLARTAYVQQLYSSAKICREFNFSFQSAGEMIRQAAPFLKQQLINR